MSAIASGVGRYRRSAAGRSVPASLWPRGAKVLAGAALAIGVIGLLGWLTHDAALRSFIGGQAQIKANTAIALVLAGGAALIEAFGVPGKHTRRLAITLGIAVTAISLATLIESLTRADLGIDRLLFADVVRPGAPHAGRMAPSTAIAFLLIGTTIVLTAVQRRPLLRQIFALGAAVIALVALLGYASDAPSLYGFAASTKMALPTALGLLTLAFGLLATQPGSGPMAYFTQLSPGARMGIKLLPMVIVIPTILGLLRLAGTRLGLFGPATGLWVASVLTITFFCGVIAVYARELDHADAQRREDAARQQRQIEQLNGELEQRAQQRASELEAANHELEAFAYSLAHDLRAPLRAIAGFGAALARTHGDQLDDSGLELLSRMRRASGRMGNLIDGLLLLSELTRRRLEFEPVDLAEIAEEVAEELRAEDSARHVEFEIDQGLYVLGDEALLRILMHSLLENAWKFTATTSEPRIAVTRAGPGVFAVSDNGAGFNMDFADLLFKPFSRLHREDEFPGTGIGLTTAERIALRHGGAIWGEGQPGAGATFYLKLDLLQEALI